MLRKYFIILFLSISIQEVLFTQDFYKLSNERIKNVNVKIGTFLGDWKRNYYGDIAPSDLNVLWKLYLGKGITIISKKAGEKEWEGCGWTGQPLLLQEDDKLFLVQGAFDHNVKKIDAENGKLIWQYKFDDVVKGTGTIWINKNADSLKESIVILQGSRRGVGKYCDSDFVPSYRAVSYFSGEELWRLDVKRTRSYSRDVDGSALVLRDTAYIGLENALFTVFNPDVKNARNKNLMLQPHIYQELPLFDKSDVIRRGGRNKEFVNLVVESSPCLLNDHIYITTGSGHVFGYNIKTKDLDWDFFIGADIDGSPVVTSDSCILVAVEKQYIEGKGGLFKLNPIKSPSKSVVWYFPTENDSVESWEGGIIGSPCINDRTKKDNHPYLAACIAIDGYLYVINHKEIDIQRGMVAGPNNKKMYPCPKIVYKKMIGPSICTPIIVGNKVVAPGYKGLFLFEFDDSLQFSEKDSLINIEFESTPIVHQGRMYIGARDGFLYCFGR